MDAATRSKVRQRAGQRCEYCRIPDAALDLPFHVDHIIASVHQQNDDPTNLAWACPRCNLGKGPNLATIDHATGSRVDVFNPRTMNWSDHFEIRDGAIVGLSPCGRGTAKLLGLNSEQRVEHRRVLIAGGEYHVD
jgi:hypothetical protein